MGNSDRTKNTKRNIVVSYLCAAITIVFQFISRTVIMSTFGSEYLGLTSLVTSILGVLNMAELGFSGAVVYNMYRPIAEGDESTVCAILAYYRRVYYAVGTCILVVGIACTPFLPHLIKGGYPQDVNIYLVFILYLANAVISYYLFAYMNALLTALQRMDLTKLSTILVSIVQYGAQIVSLVYLRNFYLFIVCLVLGTALQNIVTYVIARREFPQYVCKGSIDKGVRRSIISRVKGIVIGRVSSVTYTTFDSIILSTFIGLGTVAIYNNYLTVYNGVTNLVTMLRSAMDASVGDSVASETVEKNYGDLFLCQFVYSCIAIVGSTCMVCLYQPFMELWMGKEMLLPTVDAALLSLLFFIVTVQHSYFLYLSGNGLWWELRWPYILSTVTNLLMNVFLGQMLGTTGIILATVISSFVFGYIWQSRIIFRLYFETSPARFDARQLLFLIVGIVLCGTSFALCGIIPVTGVAGLALRAVVSVGVSATGISVVFGRSDECRRALSLLNTKRVGAHSNGDRK